MSKYTFDTLTDTWVKAKHNTLPITFEGSYESFKQFSGEYSSM